MLRIDLVSPSRRESEEPQHEPLAPGFPEEASQSGAWPLRPGPCPGPRTPGSFRAARGRQRLRCARSATRRRQASRKCPRGVAPGSAPLPTPRGRRRLHLSQLRGDKPEPSPFGRPPVRGPKTFSGAPLGTGRIRRGQSAISSPTVYLPAGRPASAEHCLRSPRLQF